MSDPDRTRPDPSRPEERPSRSSRTLPILLITAGVALLLGRAGLFDWSLALGVLQLWPLLLIALGADILTRGRYRLPIVLGAVLLGALFYRAPGWMPVVGGEAEVHEVAVRRGDVRSAEVRLSHGIGVLRIEALPAGSGLLAGGEIATGARERLERSFDVEGDVARLSLRTRGRGPSISFGNEGRRWDLALARDLPIDLEVDAGVGESRLDLSDLTLSAFDLDSGVGEVHVTLPARGGYAGEIDAGVGEVRVRIPRGVEARVVADGGLGGIDVNGEWVRDGDAHTSPGFDAAPPSERLTLRIDGGVGSITVDRVD